MWTAIGLVCFVALVVVFVCCLQMAKMSDDEEHDDAILRSILEYPVDAREWAKAQRQPHPSADSEQEGWGKALELTRQAVERMPAVFRSARKESKRAPWMDGGNAHQRRLQQRYLSRLFDWEDAAA